MEHQIDIISINWRALQLIREGYSSIGELSYSIKERSNLILESGSPIELVSVLIELQSCPIKLKISPIQ